MTQISTALIDFNPWWKGGFEIEFKEREIYKQIQKFIKMPQIIALTGLRRVGKTTLMHKIIKDSITSGSDPRKIIYFSFDEFSNIGIRELLTNYEELTGKSLQEAGYTLLLDEVQKLNNWENQLKIIYDSYKGKIKIVVSGSESLFIRKRLKENLAGRIFEFKIEPLSFREFLVFNKVEIKQPNLYEKELKKFFSDYVLTLGFPELVGVSDKKIIKKYLKEGIVEKVLYRDLPKVFEIRDISVLESLLNIFMEEPGQIVEVSELAKELKISRQTVSTYLSYLENSFLIKKLYNFSRNRRKVERKLKKYYPSIISIDLLFREDDFSKSKVFEWLMVSQLNAEFFWRDPYKNEVDIVLVEDRITPIEIKYGKTDASGLLAFMKKFNVGVGHIISYDKEDEQKANGKKVLISPAFKFLLFHDQGKR